MKIIRGNTLEMIFSLVYIIENLNMLGHPVSIQRIFFNMSQSLVLTVLTILWRFFITEITLVHCSSRRT